MGVAVVDVEIRAGCGYGIELHPHSGNFVLGIFLHPVVQQGFAVCLGKSNIAEVTAGVVIQVHIAAAA